MARETAFGARLSDNVARDKLPWRIPDLLEIGYTFSTVS